MLLSANLTLHLLEELSSLPKSQTIIQQVVGGVTAPNPPDSTSEPRSKPKLRVYGAELKDRLLLETKQRILKMGLVEPDLIDQFKQEISELKTKLKEMN